MIPLSQVRLRPNIIIKMSYMAVVEKKLIFGLKGIFVGPKSIFFRFIREILFLTVAFDRPVAWAFPKSARLFWRRSPGRGKERNLKLAALRLTKMVQ